MKNTPKHTNRLIDETSPYLLQHAHNPVNWKPWSSEEKSSPTTATMLTSEKKLEDTEKYIADPPNAFLREPEPVVTES